MKPVYQTRFRDKGNCVQAAIASYFELDLEDVPDFVTTYGDDWSIAFDEWLNQKYKLTVYFHPYHKKQLVSGWGLQIGMSPRGLSHMVVTHDGIMMHDPHPSNRGLISIRYNVEINSI